VSLTKGILKKVAMCGTAAAQWKTLKEMGASQTQAKKGAMTVDEYIGKMRSLADEMASAWKPIDDEDLVSYICTALDIEFNLIHLCLPRAHQAHLHH
jgi:hypothetical protein